MNPLQPFDISLSGINLVEASAGTGKTYSIASLYIRTLIERDVTVNQILVVTFTKAATKELKDRLLRRLRESITTLRTGKDQGDQFLGELLDHVSDPDQAIEKLQQAIRTFDEAAIFTIHGFCQHALQEQAFESRALYETEMTGDDAELKLEVIDDYWRRWIADASEDPLKQPVVKLITTRYTPEKLADQLGSYVGQPYLKVLPENPPDNIEAKLQDLQHCYQQLQELWQQDRAEILRLLSRDEMSNYRESWLEGWFDKMDTLLSSDVAPIEIFDQFSRFTQSRINNSLKKAAEENGVSPPQHQFFTIADEYRELTESLLSYPVLFKLNLLRYLREELQKRKEELEVLSYDDLLLQLEAALYTGEWSEKLAQALRQRYPIALVDEFQDTDPCQYNIFRRIYNTPGDDCALFMIGDPKQSIYSFRGADVFSYLEAKKDADGRNMFSLARNFRSVPRLIDGINAIFGDHANPFVVQQINFNAVKAGWPEDQYETLTEYGQLQPPLQFRNLGSDNGAPKSKKESADEVAEDTAREIQRLLNGGRSNDILIGDKPVEASDIAVLVRKHKQADLIKEALQKRDIKSVQYSQQNVFKSEEAYQLTLLLKAVTEPANESHIKIAMATPLMGYSARELVNIEEDDNQWLTQLDRFATWHKQWQEEGFAAMFGAVMKESSIATRLIRYADGERRLTNVLHLAELLQEQDRQRKGGMRGMLKWLARKRKEATNQQDEEQLRLESDEELVKIVTIHRSKGLEYPIVFCPFLWHGPEIKESGRPLVFHDDGETYLDLSGKNDPDRTVKRWKYQREQLAESMRLAYVAMTRAGHRCYLSWCYAQRSEFSPLGYLLLGEEISAGLLEETISNKYDAQGGAKAEERIAQLCAAHPGLFDKTSASDQPRQAFGEELMFDFPTLKVRTFSRMEPLLPRHRVSSFSSLTSVMDNDPDTPDYDQFLYEEEPEAIEDKAKTIFTFPKGPQPGTCIHKIFEDIDFRDIPSSENIIQQNLSAYNIDEQWTSVVSKMLQTSVHKSLLPDTGLKLADVEPQNMVQELEFYYQTERIASRQLLDIIRSEKEQYLAGGDAAAGFLKGYIDLTFKFGDKYYLLDYKTNYLGGEISDYDQPSLRHEIREASYDLQYHIYTIALHRFLNKKLPDYSYEKHFGGAFYLFLRGINPDGKEGIFYDRPAYQTIQKLNRYISEGGER